MAIIISEVAPWSSGVAAVGDDWFELTNTGASAVNITGWKMDDNSNSFASSVPMSGITMIGAGESVIFIEANTNSAAQDKINFINTWFGGSTNVQIGSYAGAGVGLSQNGDAVNIFNSAGVLQANVSFGANAGNHTFDIAAGASGAISTLSTAGTNGAFSAPGDATEIGSPGSIATPDTTPPTLSSSTPADDAANVSPNTNITLTFSENVQKGTGDILIKDSGDNSVVQTIDVTNAAVTVSGANVTINPPSDLAGNHGYYIEVQNGAIADTSGNAFAGISGSSALNFTTSASETQTVDFAPASVSVSHSEGDSGTTDFVFTVERTGGTTGDVNFSGTFASAATNDADYTGGKPVSFSGTILSGDSTGTVTIHVAGDTAFESDENFALTLNNASNTDGGVNVGLGANLAATGTIQNDDFNVDLSKYVLVARIDLPEPTRTAPPDGTSLLAQEASAVTYDWDTDTLFVAGDGGTSIVQLTKTGQLINSMTLAPGNSPQGTTFYDTEGLSYIGNGQFVMTEERDRNAVLFTYQAGTTLDRAHAETAHLGTFVGNIGLEGVTNDPLTGGYIFVKEKQPESIFQTNIDFATDTASNGSASTDESTNLFDPTKLNVADMADVYALSNQPGLSGHAAYGNLLVLSQESGVIVETDRSGNVLSTLVIPTEPNDPGVPGNLDVGGQSHEGTTMDRNGFLYTVAENGGGDADHPQLWVYAPSDVPNTAPTAIALTHEVTSLPEDTSTTARVRVADIAITDDGQGTNNFSVTGPDAAYFEADNTGLYIKAGTVLDFETKPTYNVTVNVDDPSVGATPDASTPYTLQITDVVEGSGPPALYISEVAPWSSGNSPVAADWFEVTNASSSAVDITGWKMDDNSDSFGNAVALQGITSIGPHEFVIFIETGTGQTGAGNAQAFINTWFGGTAPAGLQIGSYGGSGVGLSTGGDHVNLFSATGILQANVQFGPSTSGPFESFNNAAGLNNTAISMLSAVGTNGAFHAASDANEIGSPGTVGKLFISEVAPWSSGNSPVAADWFEVTNTTAFAADITGWKMDDNSQSFAASVALQGITSIGAGESVIFIETGTGQTAAGNAQAFINDWFGGTAPADLQIGNYGGSGVGLSSNSNAVNLYNSTGVLQASVNFGASPSGPFETFDNSAGLNNATISTLSAAGVNGAFAAANDSSEIGSPGLSSGSSPLPNAAPTAITLEGEITSIADNTSTATRVKISDVSVTDDGQGTNNLSVSGPDAANFEVDSTGLYIRAGTVLDATAHPTYNITVNVDDPTVGATPDASTPYTLNVTHVVAPPPASVHITEVAPWSSGNSPFAADWFELTNSGSSALDITGWKMDDNSNSFANSVAMQGITSIAAGESVIFIETGTGQTAAGNVQGFINDWFGGTAPAGLQIGSYGGSGVGLSSSGDAVNIFNSSGALQANVQFGASPTGPFETFNNAAGLNNTTISTLSAVGTNGAFAAVSDPNEIGSPGTVGKLFISEVAPWSSGNSPFAADWFEVTNTTASAVDITGWKMDDNSASFGAAVALQGVTSIGAGESVIFIETGTGQTAAGNAQGFINDWFGGTAPAGLHIGSYAGSGVGLSSSSDAVNLYNSTGVLQASVNFGASPTGPFETFDNAAGLNNATISTLSAVGTNGAFASISDPNEIGSPGSIVTAALPNQAPVATDDTLSSIAEDSGDRTISFASLTGNDSAGPASESGQTLTIIAVANAVGGTVAINGSSVIFSPTHDYNGPASFDYTVQDNGTTNGVNDFKTDVGSVSFTITPVNDPPSITSLDRFSIAENHTAIGSVTATDPENDSITYSISGGDDHSFFAIDPNGGALSFQTAPDFETPLDGNHDNVYLVDVTATDQFGAATTQNVSVTVTDVAEPGHIVNGTSHNDVLSGTTGDDTINGGSGLDLLSGGDGNDNILGGNGNDTISGGHGSDIINAGNGDDSVDGGLGDNQVIGGGGNDFIVTSDGADTISGDDGADTISSGDGADFVSGGNGNDHIDGGNGDNVLFGEESNDTISAGDGNDYIDGGDGNDVLTAGNGNNTVLGEDGADNLSTGNGNDILTGGDGNDTLSAGDGNDTLTGGNGKDVLTGGLGADVFIFGPAAASNTDKVTDFQVGVDQMQFAASDYGLPAGVLDSGNFVLGTKAIDHHAEFIYNAAAMKLMWDADGIGGVGPVAVATFDSAIALTHSDLILV